MVSICSIDKRIQQFVPVIGPPVPSYLESFLVWKQLEGDTPLHLREVPRSSDDQCKICGGLGEMKVEGMEDPIRCFCNIKRNMDGFVKAQSFYGSPLNGASFANFVAWGDPQSAEELTKIKTGVMKWAKWPAQWLVLSGGPGTGKSHLLQSIAKALYPIALYITSNDLESKSYASLGDNTLEDMIVVLKDFPVLLLDDIGSDYGKDYYTAVLRRIISYRYGIWREKITAIATNLNATGLAGYDPRLADRLLDTKSSIFCPFKMGSYRRKRES